MRNKTFILTKSKYVRGLQCTKALYYDVYYPKRAEYDKRTMELFAYGREFEAAIKARFDNGIDISSIHKENRELYPIETAKILHERDEVAIFEAGFLYNEVLVLADIVRKNADGSVDIFEVKSGTHLSQTYQRDVAIQYYVISHNIENIRSFNIIHAAGAGKDAGIVVADQLAYCHSQLETISQNVERFKEILHSQEPYIEMGDQCTRPYACPYQNFCRKLQEAPKIF